MKTKVVYELQEDQDYELQVPLVQVTYLSREQAIALVQELTRDDDIMHSTIQIVGPND